MYAGWADLKYINIEVITVITVITSYLNEKKIKK
jgi:hypothetical protein